MALIDEVINLTITREDVGITRVGFGTPLILGSSVPTIVVPRTYSNLAEVLVDYPAVDDVNKPEYIIASKLFSQDLKPTRVLIGQKATDDTFLEAYGLIKLQTTEFYAVLLTSQVAADILAIAGAVETESRIFGVSTSEANVLTDTATNILKSLNALNLKRTFVFYSANAAADRPEAAILGRMLPRDPGSETWAFQRLSGVTADALNSSQRDKIRLRNGNFFTLFGSVNTTQGGIVVSGEHIDIVHGLDWLEQFTQENVATLLVSVGKIPYNNNGIGLVVNVLEASLREAVNRGVINDDFTITTPDLLTISSIDKANRLLPDVTFTATLTGAIEKMIINGSVSV